MSGVGPEEGRHVERDRFRHGLVVGKFYPPHAGHDFLVRSAAAFCERVSVLVLGSSVESIPVAARVAWLRETHARLPQVRIRGGVDDVPVDYQDDRIWRAHVAIFRRLLEDDAAELGLGSGSADVDAVFASEPYGAELARRLGAVPVTLDLPRSCVPVSGTAVRADPAAAFDHLAPPVRAGLALRVVVVGAESTGTTTLAAELAAALRARGGTLGRTGLVAEYGREYSQAKLAVARGAAARRGAPEPTLGDLVWTAAELELIAAEQLVREEAAARLGGPVLVCDTDVLATLVWHERYVGPPSPALADLAATMPARALYLLTSPRDVPFEDDGLRDGEHLREAMTERFRAVLAAGIVPFVEVVGGRRQRTAAALDAVDGVLRAGWALADPLTADPLTAEP